MNATNFLATLTEEILDPQEYNDVSGISSQLAGLQQAMQCLESVETREDVDRFFRCQGASKLASLLLGASIERLQSTQQESLVVNQLVNWRNSVLGRKLDGIVVGLLLAEAQASRTQRRRRKFSDIVKERLIACLESRDEFLTLKTPFRLTTGGTTRLFDYVIFLEGRPLVAVVDIFQTTAGGRQQDIFLGLPELQDALAKENVVLLVIADGPGFNSMIRVVQRVAPRLEHLTNLASANQEEVEAALNHAISLRQGLTSSTVKDRDDALNSVTTLALRSGRIVTPKLLGISEEEADDFFLRYEAAHQDYAIVRQRPAQLLPDSIEQIKQVNTVFDAIYMGRATNPSSVAQAVGEKLGYPITLHTATDQYSLSLLRMPDLQLRLPNSLPVFVLNEHRTASNNSIFDELDRKLSQGSVVSRIALVIDTMHPEVSKTTARKFAAQQRSQVAVLDRNEVVEILLRKKDAAQKYLIRTILRNIDLSLVSPFVSEGPTPYNMFFGRELEIRRIVEQVQQQSFALIGGRKAGKTSILQRLKDILPDRIPICYVDCQAHPDRQDFLSYLASLTDPALKSNKDVTVAQAERVIRAFLASKFGNNVGVLLLDEVDELFAADSQAEQYRHVLSRALRSVSQSSTASLVATGERALFELTTDPSSPHWNFCSPVKIGPLSDDAAHRLLSEPLAALGVQITAEAIKTAVLRTARHPNLLQFLGNQIVDALALSSRTGTQLFVEEGNIKSLTNSPEFRNRFIKTFWSQATSLEKLLSIQLKSGNPKQVETIYEELTTEGLTMKVSRVVNALAFLELYSIAQQVDGGYIFASEAFDTYFSPLATSAIIEQWKEELR